MVGDTRISRNGRLLRIRVADPSIVDWFDRSRHVTT